MREAHSAHIPQCATHQEFLGRPARDNRLQCQTPKNSASRGSLQATDLAEHVPKGRLWTRFSGASWTSFRSASPAFCGGSQRTAAPISGAYSPPANQGATAPAPQAPFPHTMPSPSPTAAAALRSEAHFPWSQGLREPLDAVIGCCQGAGAMATTSKNKDQSGCSWILASWGTAERDRLERSQSRGRGSGGHSPGSPASKLGSRHDRLCSPAAPERGRDSAEVPKPIRGFGQRRRQSGQSPIMVQAS